jgi:hypothetical protein
MPIIVDEQSRVKLLTCDQGRTARVPARWIAKKKTCQAQATTGSIYRILGREVRIEAKSTGRVIRLRLVVSHPHELAAELESVIAGDLC